MANFTVVIIDEEDSYVINNISGFKNRSSAQDFLIENEYKIADKLRGGSEERSIGFHIIESKDSSPSEQLARIMGGY